MAGDERYMISLDDHIRELREEHLREIGRWLSNNDTANNWIHLSTRLGLDDRIGAVRHLPHPGMEILLIWRQRDRSTVRVLRGSLTLLQRDDVVGLLDQYRYDLIHLFVLVTIDGKREDISADVNGRNGVPSRKPFIHVIRAHISRRFGHLLQRNAYCCKFQNLPNALFDFECRKFLGQEVTLNMEKIPPAVPERVTWSGSEFSEKYDDNRRAITILDQNKLFFSICNNATPPEAEVAEPPTVELRERNPSTRPNHRTVTIDDIEYVQENATTPIQATPDIPSTPSTPTSLQTPVTRNIPTLPTPPPQAPLLPRPLTHNISTLSTPAPKVKTSKDIPTHEIEQFRGIRNESLDLKSDFTETPAFPLDLNADLRRNGFHPEIPLDDRRRDFVHQLLTPYGHENGRFLLRRRTDSPGLYILSTTFNQKILHFYILTQLTTDQSTTYSFFEDGFKARNFSELIEHYRTHPMTSPTSPLCELVLTQPV